MDIGCADYRNYCIDCVDDSSCWGVFFGWVVDFEFYGIKKYDILKK